MLILIPNNKYFIIKFKPMKTLSQKSFILLLCFISNQEVNSQFINTLAGNGSYDFSGNGGATTLTGMQPTDVTLDPSGNRLISGNNRVRSVDHVTGFIQTVCGSGASFYSHEGASVFRS